MNVRLSLYSLYSFLFLAGLAPSVWSQPPWQWTQLQPPASPGPRSGHAAAYDSSRAVTVLFGSQQSLAPETWEYNGNTWSITATTGPSPRWGHVMTHDSSRGSVLLFSGTSNSPLQDTWEYSAQRWTQRQPAHAPPARIGAALVFDQRAGVAVLFGGQTPTGKALGDTWLWDGVTWSQLATAGPGDRHGHVMVHDILQGAVLLFGGVSPLTTLGDTWALQPLFISPLPDGDFGDAPDGGPSGYTSSGAAAVGQFPSLRNTTNFRFGVRPLTIADPDRIVLGTTSSREPDALAGDLELDDVFTPGGRPLLNVVVNGVLVQGTAFTADLTLPITNYSATGTYFLNVGVWAFLGIPEFMVCTTTHVLFLQPGEVRALVARAAAGGRAARVA